MAKQIIQGGDLMLFDSNGHSIGYATSHTLTLSGETAETSSKDHGVFGAQTLTKVNWEIQSENLFTLEEFDSLFDAMIKRDKVLVYFGMKDMNDVGTKTVVDDDFEQWGVFSNVTGSTTTDAHADYSDSNYSTTNKGKAYYGKAFITNLAANAPNGENATFSVTFTGAGQIARCAAPTA